MSEKDSVQPSMPGGSMQFSGAGDPGLHKGKPANEDHFGAEENQASAPSAEAGPKDPGDLAAGTTGEFMPDAKRVHGEKSQAPAEGPKDQRNSAEAGENLRVALLDPAPDFPVQAAAEEGLHKALSALALDVPDVLQVKERLPQPTCAATQGSTATTTSEALAAFSRRRSRHRHYLMLVHAGLTSAPEGSERKDLLRPVYQLAAVSALRLVIDGWRPSKDASARWTRALARPDLKASRAWTLAQRQRAAADAIHELRVAISKNPRAAAAIGLTPSDLDVEPAPTEIEEFNRKFRRRQNHLQEYKTADMQAGAGGSGTLSKAGLKAAGRELLAGVRAGGLDELHVTLEIVSKLTSELIQELPVQLGAVPPAGALAWLDVPQGAYHYTLFKLVERGARPDVSTESLYETSRQVVRIDLSPPIATALRTAGAAIGKEQCTCKELLGPAAHKPRDAVAGSGIYTATAAKIQASIPALLLQDGEHRWLACLASCSPFVISRGRPAYGVARQSDVDAVVDSACDLLGWPRPSHKTEGDALVGGFSTPKVLAVRLAFDTVAKEADALTGKATTIENVVACLNAHAAYIALLLCLVLALRNRVVYALPTPGLRTGVAIKFCDKDIHEFSMPAVPMARLASSVLQQWEQVLCEAVKDLHRIDSPDALELAGRLQARLADHVSDGWVFVITAAHTLEPVGVRTWRDRLPKRLRLVQNFGRQFWPFQLMTRGVRQSDMDILMRHQMPALHPGSSHICEPGLEVQNRLSAAVQTVLDDLLQLPVPVALSGGGQGVC